MTDEGKKDAADDDADTAPEQQFAQGYIKADPNSNADRGAHCYRTDQTQADEAIFFPYTMNKAIFGFLCFMGFGFTVLVYQLPDSFAEEGGNKSTYDPTYATGHSNGP